MGKLRVFEAFAGIGSQSIALENLGIDHEVVAISEIDQYALKAYEATHREVNNLGDISKVSVEDIPDHDLFTYSFPCTDISIAGKREGLAKGSGTRSGLLWECQRVIETKKPKYLLLENVKNLVGKKFKGDFDKWLEWLETQGYKNYWKVLNAKDFGVPQNRERVFVVSIRGPHKEYTFPEGYDNGVRVKDILEKNVDRKYYIETERAENLIAQLAARGELEGEQVPCDSSIKEPKAKEISNCIISRYNAGIQNHKSTGLAVAVRQLDGGYKIRKLMPLECWRLMGYTDQQYINAKELLEKDCYGGRDRTDSQMYKMAGNSIVVGVLEGIFGEMLKGEREQKETKEKDKTLVV